MTDPRVVLIILGLTLGAVGIRKAAHGMSVASKKVGHAIVHPIAAVKASAKHQTKK